MSPGEKAQPSSSRSVVPGSFGRFNTL